MPIETKRRDIYFDEIADISLMTPAQEQERAQQIAELRHKYWAAILAYPPLAEGMAHIIARELPDTVPSATLDTYCRTARALRDRQTTANRVAFATAVEQVKQLVAAKDLDGVASGAIVADLEKLGRGQLEGVTLSDRRPPTGSRRYALYLDEVHAAGHRLQAVRHAFARANLRLVVKVARRYVNDHLSLGDLVQEGNLGLMTAVDRFDHRKGVRFSTYACWWIRHAIQRAIANKGRTIRIPCHMSDAHSRVLKARWALQARLGRLPTAEEIEADTNVRVEKIESMDQLVLSPAKSLDAPIPMGEGLTLLDTVEDEEAGDPTDQIHLDQSRQRVREALQALSPIELDVLRKRFGLDEEPERTLRQLGSEHSLSRERIRQIQVAALEKLREHLSE